MHPPPARPENGFVARPLEAVEDDIADERQFNRPYRAARSGRRLTAHCHPGRHIEKAVRGWADLEGLTGAERMHDDRARAGSPPVRFHRHDPALGDISGLH